MTRATTLSGDEDLTIERPAIDLDTALASYNGVEIATVNDVAAAGLTTAFRKIASDGSTDSAWATQGIAAVSHEDVGTYRVTFSSAIKNVQVTPITTGSTAIYATVNLVGGQPTQAVVQTYAADHSQADQPFSIFAVLT